MNRVGIAALVVALATAACGQAPAGSGSVSTPTAVPVASPTALATPIAMTQYGYEFDTPSADAQPTLSASDATAKVPLPVGAIAAATPVLEVFTNTRMTNPDGSLVFDHVLVWDIQRTGCFPVPQPSPAPGQEGGSPIPCYSNDHYMIDARTGEMVEDIQMP